MMTLHEYPRLDERVYRETLSNGLTLMVVPKPGFSRKIAYFFTDYGAIHTNFAFEGKEYRAPDGIAHFLEHKLFDMPGDRDVTAELASLGANVNAFTSYDMTAYYFSCTENFAECLKILVEFVSTPYFTQESVEKELGIIDQEIGMNEDAPDTRVYENLIGAAYENHPVRVPILGTRETIRQITPEMLHLCHRAFYTPGNMILCVVGDVEPESVKSIALEILGEERKEVGVKLKNWDEPASCRESLVTDRMEVAMPMFNMLFKCPALEMGEAGTRRANIADLACSLLFSDASELFQQLYNQGIIDYSFGGGFEDVEGCSMLMISGDSRDPETVREAIFDQAEKLVAEGIPEEEFRRAIRGALSGRIRALDNFDTSCFRLCAHRMVGFDYFEFPRIYDSITAEDVRSFLAEVIRRDNCALSILYPLSQEETYES